MYSKHDNLTEWKKIREKLVTLYKENDSSKGEFMEKGISLLEDIVSKNTDASPINMEERFHFIKSNKHIYTAFRQLDEMFKETEKRIASLKAQKHHK
ncbi:YpoC family protein [Psychrobacillus vulpis]|uniref:YpoC-like domain-containing protein n=1 Tax=Psychrobacillus vulpis TaxID=2325572 RepID=A0A544TQM1_9BACI|nr:hypothetical protein [Psychrobacillus vulpis]TQR19743.1 hypothetical protein FG384_11040 [Psychrobacillus vulpis]